MTLEDIRAAVDGVCVCGSDLDKIEVKQCFASDMMSKVLAQAGETDVLITGICNSQVIRTAEMLDMKAVLCVKGMEPSEEMIEVASGNGIAIIKTDKTMFVACGILYEKGVGIE